jgi:phosphoadenosine phosphosulfate reductase
MQADTISHPLSQKKIRELARYFETRPAEELLDWAAEHFTTSLTQACSFGLEDVALVDLMVSHVPAPDIFYLNTGFLFPETLETRDRLSERYHVKFREILPKLTVAEQSRIFGEELYRRAPAQCCWLRKIEPLKRALSGYSAWITGIRRDQALTRANSQVVEWDDTFGLVKINPLASWTWEQVRELVEARDVPSNPLHKQGYPSIGCVPCTSRVAPGEDPRAGRWRGAAKIECGLHPTNGGVA